MSYIFITFFYQPILNLLVFIYNIIPGHDLGIAIIVLTIIIKFLLLPFSKKALQSQKALQEIQPQVEILKKKYKNDREALGKATLELYKKQKVNPFSSCLPLLIQFPFLIAVFRIFRNGLNSSLYLVYPFINKPEEINYIFLGLFDLAKPSPIFAILAGLAQFWQSKMMITTKSNISNKAAKDEDAMSAMNKNMLYIMPIFTVFIGFSFPGGLALYWLITTVLTIIQQMYVFNNKKKLTNKPNNDLLNSIKTNTKEE